MPGVERGARVRRAIRSSFSHVRVADCEELGRIPLAAELRQNPTGPRTSDRIAERFPVSGEEVNWRRSLTGGLGAGGWRPGGPDCATAHTRLPCVTDRQSHTGHVPIQPLNTF